MTQVNKFIIFFTQKIYKFLKIWKISDYQVPEGWQEASAMLEPQ